MGAFGSSIGPPEARPADRSLLPFAYYKDDSGRPSDGRGGMKTQDIAAIGMAALAGGDPVLAAQLLKEIAPTVWASCSLLSANDSDAREAFLETMAKLRADNFAHLLEYTGRGAFETFVALTVRDLLARRMLRLLQADGEKGWHGFEALFGADLQRLIHKRLPGTEHDDARKEAYQSISLALIDSDYRRLKAYNGSGSFAGFVLRSADRLLVDFIRSFAARRRLPNAVAKLAALDREVFKLVYWQHQPTRPEILLAQVNARLGHASDTAEIAAALLRVKAHANTGQNGARPVRVDIDLRAIADSPEASPEAQLVQEEESERLTAALDVLTRAVETLPEVEQLYLTIALGAAQTPPSREIAQLMQRPVEDIYKLKQRVLKQLRDLIAEESAVKNWRASV
jgi:RNA polymerase primary sigma factor